MLVKDIITIILLLILSIGLLSQNITKPFWGHHDWNSNIWTVTAKNNLTYGIACTKLGQATTYHPITNCDELGYYQTHPPLVSWVLTVSYAIFGVNEWAGRLPFILISSGSIVLIYLIGTTLFTGFVGVFASLLSLATPMFQYFGKAINHEPLVLFSILLAVFSFSMWVKMKDKRYYYWLLGSTVIAGLSDWHAYYIFPLLALISWIYYPKLRFKSLIPVYILIIIFFMHMLHTRWIDGVWSLHLFNLLLLRVYGGAQHIVQNEIIQFSYIKFLQQEPQWLRIYYSSLLPILGVIFIVKSIWIYITTKTLPNNTFIIIILGLYGSIVPMLFSQQAFIHDYLNMYLLPFFSLSTAVVLKHLIRKYRSYWSYLICVLALLFVFFEQRAYLIAVEKRDVEKQYVELARFVNNHKQENTRFLIEANNYYNFAYPFLWNYSYGTYFGNNNDSLTEFLSQKYEIEQNYDFIITISTHHADPELIEYLNTTYPYTTEGRFTLYNL